MAQSPVDDSTIMDDFVNIRAPNVNYPREVGIEDKDNHGVYRQWVSNCLYLTLSPNNTGTEAIILVSIRGKFLSQLRHDTVHQAYSG